MADAPSSPSPSLPSPPQPSPPPRQVLEQRAHSREHVGGTTLAMEVPPASAFFAVVEQQQGEGAQPRELVLELRGSRSMRLWHVDDATTSGAKPALELEEVADVIVGLASNAHIYDASGGAPRLHPFGLVSARSPPLMLASPCARERALIAAAVGAARDVQLGLPGAEEVAVKAANGRVLWGGSARVEFGAGGGSRRSLAAREAYVVLLAPAKLLIFSDSGAEAPLRVLPLGATHVTVQDFNTSASPGGGGDVVHAEPCAIRLVRRLDSG
ncbi:hypothetical protein T492DRAFT_400988 [Pavlovales sp. CCMP2436]|nr:hypothetical protein T492DRAFT_400988 [Pavlovales sp. CCMP2436]